MYLPGESLMGYLPMLQNLTNAQPKKQYGNITTERIATTDYSLLQTTETLSWFASEKPKVLNS